MSQMTITICSNVTSQEQMDGLLQLASRLLEIEQCSMIYVTVSKSQKLLCYCTTLVWTLTHWTVIRYSTLCEQLTVETGDTSPVKEFSMELTMIWESPRYAPK